jgi:hypothetical protein
MGIKDHSNIGKNTSNLIFLTIFSTALAYSFSLAVEGTKNSLLQYCESLEKEKRLRLVIAATFMPFRAKDLKIGIATGFSPSATKTPPLPKQINNHF